MTLHSSFNVVTFLGADITFVIQSGDLFFGLTLHSSFKVVTFFWADITFVIQSCAFCFGLTLDSTFNVVIFCPTLDVQGGDSFWQTFSVRRGDFIPNIRRSTLCLGLTLHSTFNVVFVFGQRSTNCLGIL